MIQTSQLIEEDESGHTGILFFIVPAQDTIEMNQNEVYGISTDGIETTPNEVHGASIDGKETTSSAVYGAAFDHSTKVLSGPLHPYSREDTNI